MTDASILNEPGPRTELRRVLPNVAVVSVTREKQDVLNHWPMLGSPSTGSQTVLGRLFVMPVDPIVPLCVIVIGRPERTAKMPLNCQPPHARCAAHGSS